MKCRVTMMIACLALAMLQAGNSLKADDENIRGAIWEVTYRVKDAEPVTRRYHAMPRGKIFSMGPSPKIIGTWKGDKEKTTMKITAAHAERFNGDFEVTMTGRKMPTWRGKFTNTKGEDIPVRIRLVKD